MLRLLEAGTNERFMSHTDETGVSRHGLYPKRNMHPNMHKRKANNKLSPTNLKDTTINFTDSISRESIYPLWDMP